MLSRMFILLAGWAGQAYAEPYPLEHFALRDVISNVQVSPDSKHLALMKIPNRDGNPVIEVYPTNDLSAEPFRVNAKPMEIVAFDWISNTSIIMALRQKVRTRIQGFNQGVYDGRIALLDIERRKFKQFKEIGPAIHHLLPKKPNKVILSFIPGKVERSKVAEPFRPRAYYEFDLKRGSKKLLMLGKISLAQIGFDTDGNPRFARGFDAAAREFLWYTRRLGSRRWEEIHRLHEDSFEDFTIEGWDHENPDILFVSAHNGHDMRGLWEFDINTKTFGELIYRRPDVDVTGVRYHSNDWTHQDLVTAIAYRTDKTHYEYFDANEEALYKQLETLTPFAHRISINSISRDGKSLTFVNRGPRDPGTYYLFHRGSLQKVGGNQPLFKGEELADVDYINWQSRDGKTIRGYLTTPNGAKPPFPLVVLPHGGPFVQEVVSYDEWGQLLANYGYLVLQPQYRGSHGYGIDFYLSAFNEDEGGQGGYKMQDDKDDGALFLVKQGLADPKRMAMFGWSYGGYAALIAASREDQIYQCVIAGAAVADTLQQVNYYRTRITGAGKVEQISMWDDSISPIKEAEKVNVPMLIIHGDVDQRVPPAHARKYIKKLDKYNKNYKYVSLKGADHFSNTLFYRHQLKLYQSIIGFLQDDCGPNGL